MTLRELQYLVALATYRNFRRAAEACLVSQPTLSTQIAKLEDELGAQLLERGRRQVMLTPAGEDAVERAQRILREVDEMTEAVRRAGSAETGTLRLGIFPTLGPYLLPPLVPLVRERFPKLSLRLFEEKSEVLLSRLDQGSLDAAFLALPVKDDHLHAEFLFEEPFLLAVPIGHPLANQDSVTLDDLKPHTLMLLEEGHCLRDQALEVCQLAGAKETAEFRATSLETLRQMVIAGMGVTLLPVLTVGDRDRDAGAMRLLPFRDAQPSRQIALVWRRTTPMAGLLRQLSSLCRQIARDHERLKV
jgi:LysR family transcriptional regulator, hydrogen peroxide-inducible genes activator